MSTSDHGMPPALRERIVADLRPVRPLADPWKRAMVFVPVGLALVALVHARWGTRADLGTILLWGLSLLQIAVGITLVIAALRDVIPDRGLPRPLQVALFAGGLALAIGVTFLAWHASGTTAPVALRYLYWRTCYRYTVEIGLPILLLIVLLASRGVMWRPTLVGSLAGLAAGLIADAGWRTFCDVAEPAHVLSAHFAGVVTLTLLGALAGKLYALFLHSR